MRWYYHLLNRFGGSDKTHESPRAIDWKKSAVNQDMYRALRGVYFKLSSKSIVAYLLLVCLLSGCASSLVFETSSHIPQPLFEPLPVNAAVVFEQALREHVYLENSEDRQNWSISTGASQVKLFNEVFASLFASISSFETLNEVPLGFDLSIEPKLKDMQLALPQETRLNNYEVWLQYEILVYRADGSELTRMMINGYGQSPSDFFSKNESGLSDAAEKAFRDLGAKIFTQFSVNPDIKTWLSAESTPRVGE